MDLNNILSTRNLIHSEGRQDTEGPLSPKELYFNLIMNNSTSVKANISTSNSPTTTPLPTGLPIFVGSFLAIGILAGTFGNARVCILLRRRQSLRKVPHYLLGSLALIGIFSTLFNIPLLMFMTVVNYFQIYDSPIVEILCKAKVSLGSALIVLNALTLSLMAFDRQECVLSPFHRRLTTRNVKKVIVVTWLIALITAAVFAVLTRNVPSTCFAFFPYNNIGALSKVFQATVAVFAQFDTISMLIIIVTFLRIVKKLRSSPVNSLSSANRRNERKLTELSFKICGIFVLFRIPVMICHMLANICKFQGNSAINTATLVAVTLVSFLYVLNPVLHHKMLNVQPPNQAGAAAMEAGERIELADGARENQNARVEQ